jgi:hypothetical protein
MKNVHAACERPVSDMSATGRRRSKPLLTRKLKITIESTFATVRHRTKVTRGRARGRPGWRWHSSSSRQPRTAGAVNAPHLVALVRAGARFERGSSSSAPRSSRHDHCGRTEGL